MKIFRQEVLPTSALDEAYERQISVSPLKYRPNIDWDGAQAVKEKNQRDRGTTDKKRMQTPDPTKK